MNRENVNGRANIVLMMVAEGAVVWWFVGVMVVVAVGVSTIAVEAATGMAALAWMAMVFSVSAYNSLMFVSCR